MAPKAKGSARARSKSAPKSGPKAKAKGSAARGSGSASPGPSRNAEAEHIQQRLRECIAPDDVEDVDIRVLDITVSEALNIAGVDGALLRRSQELLADAKAYQANLEQQRAEVFARQEEDNEVFKDACYARKAMQKTIEMLFDAVSDGELDKVQEYYSGAGNKDKVAPRLPIDLMDHEQNTLLSEAACYNFADIVEFLLDLGAHPNARNDQGRTPIFRACFNGSEESVQLLLENGADPVAEANSGERPGTHGTMQTKALILGWSPEEFEAKQEELTPLQRLPNPWPCLFHSACCNGDEVAVTQLLGTIASDAVNVGGRREQLRMVLDAENLADALWTSCLHGRVNVCRKLIEARADVDSFNVSGITCLMVAARKGHDGVIAELLRAGAKTHLRSPEGRVAIEYALEPASDQAHALLLRHCREHKDFTSLDAQKRSIQTNDVGYSSTMGNSSAKMASAEITAELRGMSAAELREGGERYRQLQEQRALADELGLS